MLKVLFRHFLQYNWLVALITGLVVIAASRRMPRVTQRLLRKLKLPFWLSLSCVGLLLYGILLAFRLAYPGMIDWVEVNVGSVSYLLLHGYPVYEAVNDSARYSLLYGPLCYLPYSAALKVFGHTMGALRFMLFLLNLASFCVIWVLFRQTLQRIEALFATGLLAAILITNGIATTFMIRGDILLILFITLSLVTIRLRTVVLAVMMLSLSAAACLDIKLSSIFYLLVPFYLFSRSKGKLALAAAIALTALFTLMPFAAHPISLTQYVFWLHEASLHPLAAKPFLASLIALAVGVGPLVWLWLRLYESDRREASRVIANNRLFLFIFIFSTVGTLLASSKLGAGSHHLNPTCIICIYLAAAIWPKIRSKGNVAPIFYCIGIAYTVFFVLPMMNELHQMWLVAAMKRNEALAVISDLNQILSEHQGQTIQIGYNQNVFGTLPDPITSFATHVVLAGNPYVLDGSALADMDLSGLTLPASTLHDLAACKVNIWLISRNGDPFSTYNPYALDAPNHLIDEHLFDPMFRSTFLSTYRKAGTSRFYDMWECK